jgi:hypothetical protein
MSQEQKEKQSDPLALDGIYPEPKQAFLHEPKTFAEVKATCLVFLDTNVLLLPYNTGKDSLASIKLVYQSLAKDSRLLLADRVMQEFETNVPDQLKRIFHAISKAQDINAPSIELPLLEEIDQYKSLKKISRELSEKILEYRKAIRSTLSVIENWNHNDPVRQTYREIFKDAPAATISSFKGEKIISEWNRRLLNKIPPGYKDGGKEDSGIGDFLVWQAILDTCAAQKKDAILVSGEEKPDWWHNSNQQSLYPRRELVEEFRRATGGKTIHLLKPSRFFELFGASKEAVQEIATEQTVTRKKYFSRRPAPSAFIFRAVAGWLRDVAAVEGNATLLSLSHFDYELITQQAAYRIDIKVFSTIEEFRSSINSLGPPFTSVSGGRTARQVVVLATHDETLGTGPALEYLSRAHIPKGLVVIAGVVDSDENFWPAFRSDETFP